MSKFDQEELNLIKEYSNEIIHRLNVLLKNIDYYGDDKICFKILNGRLIDIFDDYKRLHAVVMKYKKISNEDLLKMIIAG